MRSSGAEAGDIIEVAFEKALTIKVTSVMNPPEGAGRLRTDRPEAGEDDQSLVRQSSHPGEPFLRRRDYEGSGTDRRAPVLYYRFS